MEIRFLAKIGKWLIKTFGEKEGELYSPKLTNEQLNNIEEPQAKLIYDSAKHVLIGIDNSLNEITRKAEGIFKYLFTIEAAIIGILINIKGINFTKNQKIWWIAIMIAVSIPILIYGFTILLPRKIKSINNLPQRMINEKALHSLKAFYLHESIEIQQYAIPYNTNIMNKKAFWLKTMVIICGLTVLGASLTFIWIFFPNP